MEKFEVDVELNETSSERSSGERSGREPLAIPKFDGAKWAAPPICDTASTASTARVWK